MESGSKKLTNAVLGLLNRTASVEKKKNDAKKEGKENATEISEVLADENGKSTEWEADVNGIENSTGISAVADEVGIENSTGISEVADEVAMENSTGISTVAYEVEIESSTGISAVADEVGIENSTEMVVAKAAEISEAVGMEESTDEMMPESAEMSAVAPEVSQSSAKNNNFLVDYEQLYTVLRSMPHTLTTNSDALPFEFRPLHKYVGRHVEIYVAYDTILRGNLESLNGNLDCVLSDCYEDYHYFEFQFYVGIVHIEGKHLKFITELEQ